MIEKNKDGDIIWDVTFDEDQMTFARADGKRSVTLTRAQFLERGRLHLGLIMANTTFVAWKFYR